MTTYADEVEPGITDARAYAGLVHTCEALRGQPYRIDTLDHPPRLDVWDGDCTCDPFGRVEARAQAAILQRRKAHVLSQTEFWFTRDGRELRVDELSLRYKRSILAFLERRAPSLLAGWVSRTLDCASTASEHAADGLYRLADEAMSKRPVTWLYEQPLAERLEALIREGHDGPIG